MNRNSFLVILCILTVLCLTACDAERSIAPLEEASVVLAFGDSLTYGTGADKGQSYPERLENMLGNKVINAGIPGEVTSEGLKRLVSELERYQPNLVILCHGGNDFLRRHATEVTKGNVQKMIAMIKSRDIDVILVGVPKLGFGLEVPRFYARIAEEQAIPYEGDILVSLLGNNALKSDYIHPNGTGYRKLAEALFALITKSQQK